MKIVRMSEIVDKAKSNAKKSKARVDRLVCISEPWCGPCQEYKPILKKLEERYGIPVEILIYTKDKKRALALVEAESADDVNLPTLVGFKGERKVFIEEGFMGTVALERFLGLRAKVKRKPTK